MDAGAALASTKYVWGWDAARRGAFLAPRAHRANLMPAYHRELERLALDLELPSLALPLPPGDEPLARVDDSSPSTPPRPLFSFCLRPGYDRRARARGRGRQ